MIFTCASFPLPTLSRSPKRLPETSQKHSDTIPRASRELPRASLRCSGSTQEPPCDASEAPRGVSRGPRSSQKPPKTPPKLPKASPRRPRSTPRHSRGSSEVPKSFHVTSQKPPEAAPEGSVRPRADETTNDTFFEATGERGHKETRDHSQTRSQTKHASRPLGNEATKLMY